MPTDPVGDCNNLVFVAAVVEEHFFEGARDSYGVVTCGGIGVIYAAVRGYGAN